MSCTALNTYYTQKILNTLRQVSCIKKPFLLKTHFFCLLARLQNCLLFAFGSHFVILQNVSLLLRKDIEIFSLCVRNVEQKC